MIDLLKKIVAGGAVAILVLGILTIIALRRPRQQVVRIIDAASRSIRRHHPDPQVPSPPVTPTPQSVPSQTNMNMVLIGQDSSGFRYQVTVSSQDLAQGVMIGREPPDVRMAINHPDISRQHAWICARDGYARIRDNGSTNGTKVNGRTLRPRQEQVLANGDVIELGTVAFRVEIRQ